LVLMSKVDEESIVTTLKVRARVLYCGVFLIPSSQKRFLELQNIYTYIGPVLVSVNPYQKIPNTGACRFFPCAFFSLGSRACAQWVRK
jgi:hypothetical protein